VLGVVRFLHVLGVAPFLHVLDVAPLLHVPPAADAGAAADADLLYFTFSDPPFSF
jgi:hypothetical protein